MQIIEETTALGVSFCHFKTIRFKNQYNLTFTKLERDDFYEVHLIPLVLSSEDGRSEYDRDLRKFVCDKIYQFMQEKECKIYFSINCIGISNEYLVWKFSRWIKCFHNPIKVTLNITEDLSKSIRFFEFEIAL